MKALAALGLLCAGGCEFVVTGLAIGDGGGTNDLSAAAPDLSISQSDGGSDDLPPPSPDLSTLPDLATLPDLTAPPADMTGGGGGSLVFTVNPAPGAVNLTTLGTADWRHWGTRKDEKSGATLLSDETDIGGTPVNMAGGVVTYSWTDGTATQNQTSTGYRVVSGVGNGFSFTAPAEVASHTLFVYVGGYLSRGKLVAHLSDSSAPDIVDTSLSNGSVGTNGGVYAGVYQLTYRAASAAQTLTVTWTEDADLSGTGAGTVALGAAALQ